MPEGRFLSKSIAWSEQVGSVSLVADYLFTRMIPHLDSAGRISGAPKAIKAMACPLRDDVTATDVASALEELVAVGLIVWYRVGSHHFVEFPGFANHQRGARLDREAASRIPDSGSDGAELVRTYSGVGPHAGGEVADLLPLSKEKRREEKGSPAAPLRSPSAIVRIRPPRPALPDWVAAGVAGWVPLVGAITPARFHKALAPVVALHTWPVVWSDVQAWVKERNGTGKPCRLEWYAESASARITAPPMWDSENGCLTDYGERRSRPA